MNHIIVATHSVLAEGFVKAVAFFNSQIENIEFINCYVDEDMDVESKLREALIRNKEKNIILCTDIPGGSVNQFALKLLKEYEFHLVTGINLGLLLEFVFSMDDLNSEDIKEKIEMAKTNLMYVNHLPAFEEDNQTDDEL